MTEPQPDTQTAVSLDGVRHLVRQWQQARRTAAHARKRADKLAREIQTLLGDASVGTVDGRPAVRQRRVPRLAFRRLKTERPDLLDQFSVLRCELANYEHGKPGGGQP